ncbi:hypothetical protein RJT34_04117 [Clitoria ternatea]|uniref:Uncharacterized protein n=1 Tax=Clitoria ternatea TaxID=43366 RepID=A0AAN9KLZ9_CLITE
MKFHGVHEACVFHDHRRICGCCCRPSPPSYTLELWFEDREEDVGISNDYNGSMLLINPKIREKVVAYRNRFAILSTSTFENEYLQCQMMNSSQLYDNSHDSQEKDLNDTNIEFKSSLKRIHN